jgi:hypothetical protein
VAGRIVFASGVAGFLYGFGFPAFATAEAAEPNAYHYSYFKEKKPLTLDVSRVAFLRAPAEDGSVAAAPSLSAQGIDDATVAPMVIRGWSFGGTAAANQRKEQDDETQVLFLSGLLGILRTTSRPARSPGREHRHGVYVSRVPRKTRWNAGDGHVRI